MSTTKSFRLLCAATLFHFLAMGVFLSALPLFVTNGLHGSKAVVGLAIGAFSITSVVSRPWVGRRVDRLGRRWFLRGAPALISLTAVALTAAMTITAVVVLRMVQGLAGSSYYTAAATTTTDLSPDHRRADYISRFSLFLYGGFAAGPALGEVLIERFSYNAAWLTAAGFALVAALIASRIPETVPAAISADSTRSRRVFHPAALGPGLVLLTVAVGYTSIQAFTPLYARSIGMSSSGYLYATFALTILAVRLASGRMADRFGRVQIALPGLVLGVAGMGLLAAVPRPAAAFIGIAMFAACHALIFPALMALTVDRVTDAERGEVLGSFTACFDAGAAPGGLLVGYIADHGGFGYAWATPALFCVAGIVVLLLVARTEGELPRRSRASETPPMEPAGT
ncbi:MAG: MFS transporter [Acidimicrobiales bacterium]